MRIRHIRRMPLWGTVVALLFFAFPGWAKDAPPVDVIDICQSKLIVPPNTMVMLGRLRVSFDQHVYWKGEEVILRNAGNVSLEPEHNPYYFRVLMALVDQPNSPISFDELYEDAWVDKSSDHDGVEKSVRQALLWIRRAFEMVDPEFDQIKTMRNDGYFWAADEQLVPDFQTNEIAVTSSLRKVVWRGHEIRFTKAQFGVLWLMLQNPGQTLTYEKLFRAYSGSILLLKKRPEIIRSLATEIGNIRKIFKSVDPDFNRIESARAEGYGWQSQTGCSIRAARNTGETTLIDISPFTESHVPRRCARNAGTLGEVIGPN